MAIDDAMIQGKENILAYFDTFGQTPFYSLWKKQYLIYSYPKDDAQEGREKFEEALEMYETAGNRDVLILKFHPTIPEGGFITNKTPFVSSMFFRVCPYDPAAYRPHNFPGGNPNVVPYVSNDMKEVKELLTGMDSRITAMEDSGGADEPSTMGQIQEFISNPVIAGLIDKLSGIVISQIAPGQRMPGQIAGVPSQVADRPPLESDAARQQKMEAALQVLIDTDPQLDDDLSILANLAQKKPDQFSMLLGMLRSYKI
jgi:hypothetical protein